MLVFRYLRPLPLNSCKRNGAQKGLLTSHRHRPVLQPGEHRDPRLQHLLQVLSVPKMAQIEGVGIRLWDIDKHRLGSICGAGKFLMYIHTDAMGQRCQVSGVQHPIQFYLGILCQWSPALYKFHSGFLLHPLGTQCPQIYESAIAEGVQYEWLWRLVGIYCEKYNARHTLPRDIQLPYISDCHLFVSAEDLWRPAGRE